MQFTKYTHTHNEDRSGNEHENRERREAGREAGNPPNYDGSWRGGDAHRLSTTIAARPDGRASTSRHKWGAEWEGWQQGVGGEGVTLEDSPKKY